MTKPRSNIDWMHREAIWDPHPGPLPRQRRFWRNFGYLCAASLVAGFIAAWLV